MAYTLETDSFLCVFLDRFQHSRSILSPQTNFRSPHPLPNVVVQAHYQFLNWNKKNMVWRHLLFLARFRPFLYTILCYYACCLISWNIFRFYQCYCSPNTTPAPCSSSSLVNSSFLANKKSEWWTYYTLRNWRNGEEQWIFLSNKF